MANMPTVWTKNISDPEKAAAFEATVRNSSTALLRLLDLVQEWENSLCSSEITIEDFKDPNWAEKQAWRNGGKAFAKKLKDTISFLKG